MTPTVRRWMWGTIGIVIVVFAVGVTVATIPSDPTGKIAAFAATIAVLSLMISGAKHLYDVYDKEREAQKKADDKRERLTAEVVYQAFQWNTPVLGVRLYNAGQVMVPIKEVVLVVESDGAAEAAAEQWVLTTPAGYFQPHHNLEPKHHVVYTQPTPLRCIKAARIVATPGSRLHLSVKSFSGEVLRVPGPQIIDSARVRPSDAEGQ